MSRFIRNTPQIASGLFFALVVGVIGLYHDRALAQKSEAQAPADWVAEIEKIPTEDSVAARKFLKSVDFEARHLPETAGLAINDR
jgi:hypothetical protein